VNLERAPWGTGGVWMRTTIVNSVPPGAPQLKTRMTRSWSVLQKEWRAALSREHLTRDLVAGVSVGLVALPLTIAIALASDVPVGVGLVSAVVTGIVAAWFGGSRLTVTGPAAVMAVLVGQIVDRHGLASLLVVGVVAGALQIAIGALGLARLARVVPLGVVRGFTAGIGLTLIVSQLPRALGLPASDESHVLDVLLHLVTYASQAHPLAAGFSLFALGVTLLGATYAPRWPLAVLGVLVPTLVAVWVGVDDAALPRLGAISAPFTTWPTFVWPGSDMGPLLVDAIAVAVIGTIEALARSVSGDLERASGSDHDPDQETIGQGLANVASALVGGIPVTAVLSRSELNVKAGAATRRASVIAALVVLGLSFALASVLPLVPVAALAGLIIAIAIRMMALPYFVEVFRTSRTEALVFAVTVVSMVAFDIGAGVQVGALVALVAALVRVTRIRVTVDVGEAGVPHHVGLAGPLTFLATARIEALGRQLARLPIAPGFVIDLKQVESADATALDHLVGVVTSLKESGGKVAFLGANAQVGHAIRELAPALGSLLTIREADLDRVLERSRVAHGRSQLVSGVRRFRSDVRENLAPLLQELSAGQAPHTLLLTCADSRVVPSLLTGTSPGELFCVRNIGALLPPFGHDTLNDEGAGLEYAIEVLGVRNVVVCGHSKCGAMGALKKGGLPDELRALQHWAVGARALIVDPDAHLSVDDLTRATSVKQLDHFRSYPVVKRALENGELTLSAWFYDVDRAEVLEWSEERERFVAVGEPEARLSRAPAPIDP
jgi:carbonic anhydrase